MRSNSEFGSHFQRHRTGMVIVNKTIEKVFVVRQKNWDNFEPDYIYPHFFYTEADAIKDAMARAVIDKEPDWQENYSVEIFWLGKTK